MDCANCKHHVLQLTKEYKHIQSFCNLFFFDDDERLFTTQESLTNAKLCGESFNSFERQYGDEKLIFIVD